jgi:hypothetical protein
MSETLDKNKVDDNFILNGFAKFTTNNMYIDSVCTTTSLISKLYKTFYIIKKTIYRMFFVGTANEHHQ